MVRELLRYKIAGSTELHRQAEPFDDAARMVLSRGRAPGSGDEEQHRPAGRTLPVVLDVGAGDCTWLSSLATFYPETQMHALDPLPRPTLLAAAITYHAQPGPHLPFASASVDLIHARKLLSSLGGEGALAELVAEAARCLRTQGLVVFVEGRNAAPASTAKGAQGLLVRNLARSHLARSGLGSPTASLAVALPALLRAHGFLDVREETLGHSLSATERSETILKRPAEGQAAMVVIWATKG